MEKKKNKIVVKPKAEWTCVPLPPFQFGMLDDESLADCLNSQQGTATASVDGMAREGERVLKGSFCSLAPDGSTGET